MSNQLQQSFFKEENKTLDKLEYNLEKRLQLHASGKGSKYTRGRGPLELVHQETFKTRSLASKRELFIKKLNRLDKIKLYND